MADKEYSLKIDLDAKEAAKEAAELKERIEQGSKAIAEFAERSGDDRLKRLAGEMRQLFDSAIRESGGESVEVLRDVDNAIGDMIVEFAELKKAQDAAAEAEAKHNAELHEQAKALADAAQAASRTRAESERSINEWQSMATLRGDDTRAWVKHVEEAERRTKRAAGRNGGFRQMLDVLGEFPGAAGAAGRSISSSLGGGVWALAAAAAVGYFRLLGKISDKLEDMKKAGEMSLPDLARLSGTAKVAADDHAMAQERVAESIESGAKAADNFRARLQELAQISFDGIAAELERTLSQIDLDETTGALSEPEANQARFDAQAKARADQRAAERDLLEKTLAEREREEQRALSNYQSLAGPGGGASRLEDRLRHYTRGGASQLPELATQRQAVKDAQKELANAPLDSEARTELNEKLQAAQAELDAAFQEMVDDALEKRREAIAKLRAAQNRATTAENATEQARRELRDFDGAGRDAFDNREAAIRNRFSTSQVEYDNRQAEQLAKSSIAAANAAAGAATAEPPEPPSLADRARSLADQVDDGRGTTSLGGASAAVLRRQADDLTTGGATTREIQQLRATIESMFAFFGEIKGELEATNQAAADALSQAANGRGAAANRGGNR